MLIERLSGGDVRIFNSDIDIKRVIAVVHTRIIQRRLHKSRIQIYRIVIIYLSNEWFTIILKAKTPNFSLRGP